MGSASSGVVVFPGAGSFGHELRGLLRELGPSSWMARYPGRFGQGFGQAAASFEEIVESCAAQVRRRELVRPVLAGHSFGAYVAYATTRKLEDQGTEISALLVVGATAPGLLTVPDSAVQDRSGTAAFLDGLLAGLSDEWRDIVLDTAAQDLQRLQEFSASEYGEVRCPVLAARGAEDPLTSVSGIREWGNVTVGEYAHKIFGGNHSDLLSSPEFVSWVAGIRDHDELEAIGKELDEQDTG